MTLAPGGSGSSCVKLFTSGANVGSMTEYAVPGLSPGTDFISNIIGDPNGLLWITCEGGTNKIFTFNPVTHAFASITLGTAGDSFGGIQVGPNPTTGVANSAIWIGDSTVHGGVYSIFVVDFALNLLTTYTHTTQPGGLVCGADGSMWCCLGSTSAILKITYAGAKTTYNTPTGAAFPHGPNLGWDGRVWFGEDAVGVSKVGAINTAGTITEYGGLTAASQPYWVQRGPMGHMVITEIAAGKIGLMTLGGVVKEFACPSGGSCQPGGVWPGPDGRSWFTEKVGNKIGAMDKFGAITEYSVPTASSNPDKIFWAANNKMYATGHDSCKIIEIVA